MPYKKNEALKIKINTIPNMKLQKLNSADAKLIGAACETCGLTFVTIRDGEAVVHGSPAVCHECWKNLSGFERRLYHRAKKGTTTR